jgi:hypothetical protein
LGSNWAWTCRLLPLCQIFRWRRRPAKAIHRSAISVGPRQVPLETPAKFERLPGEETAPDDQGWIDPVCAGFLQGPYGIVGASICGFDIVGIRYEPGIISFDRRVAGAGALGATDTVMGDRAVLAQRSTSTTNLTATGIHAASPCKIWSAALTGTNNLVAN